MSDYCDCWGQPDVAAMHKERDELRSQVERLRAEQIRLRALIERIEVIVEDPALDDHEAIVQLLLLFRGKA